MSSNVGATLTVVCLLAGPGVTQSYGASVASTSLNMASGTLDVDYAQYLAKHDVVFNQPIIDPDHGPTVGTGRVGAMIWNQDGLQMQLSGVDAAEETAFSAGFVHLYTTPGMDKAYSRFQQRLSIYDGVLTAKYDHDRTVTVMGSPNSEVMGIHVSDSRPDVSEVTLDLGIWDVRRLNGGDVPNIAAWRSVATYADSKEIGLTRGQGDPNHFGYTLSARVQGARFSTRVVDANTTRMVIEPSSSYTIWIVCASRLNAPDHDSIRQADALLNEVEAEGYDVTLAQFERWWHDFWARSFIQYADSTGADDYLENLYYLYTYIIAAGSYANYPFHFVNGAFSARGDADSNKWSVAYWHWNQRAVYDSFLASNHPEIVHVFNRLYSRNFEALVVQTRKKYGVDGIWVPEAMGWDGNDRFTEASNYTKDILSTGAEVAESMYAEYEYTNDVAYLRATAYPFIKAIAQFYSHELARPADTGEFYLRKSNALETYWGVENAITDLAAIRSLFPVAIGTSRALGVDPGLRSQWKIVLDHLAAIPVATDGRRYVPHEPPATESHNWQNVTSELIWPYNLTGIGAADYEKALDGWVNRPFPYSNVWANDAVQAARLGLGNDVLKGMRLMIQTYQIYPNGLTENPAGRFEYLGTHLSAINESLLQSYNRKIRIFPAIPQGFAGRFTLLARGGFLVTSEWHDGSAEYVLIKSLRGNDVAVENPWQNESVRIRRLADNATILASAGNEFSFRTCPDAIYLIERKDVPISAYPHVRLTGSPNEDGKRLRESKAALGSFLGQAASAQPSSILTSPHRE